MANPGPVHRYQEHPQTLSTAASASACVCLPPSLGPATTPPAAISCCGNSPRQRLAFYFVLVPSHTRPHLRKDRGKGPASLGTSLLTVNKLSPHALQIETPHYCPFNPKRCPARFSPPAYLGPDLSPPSYLHPRLSCRLAQVVSSQARHILRRERKQKMHPSTDMTPPCARITHSSM